MKKKVARAFLPVMPITNRLKIKREHSSSNDADEHELFLKIINDSHPFVSFDDKNNDEPLNMPAAPAREIVLKIDALCREFAVAAMPRHLL